MIALRSCQLEGHDDGRRARVADVRSLRDRAYSIAMDIADGRNDVTNSEAEDYGTKIGRMITAGTTTVSMGIVIERMGSNHDACRQQRNVVAAQSRQ